MRNSTVRSIYVCSTCRPSPMEHWTTLSLLMNIYFCALSLSLSLYLSFYVYSICKCVHPVQCTTNCLVGFWISIFHRLLGFVCIHIANRCYVFQIAIMITSSATPMILPATSMLQLLGRTYDESISLTSKYNQVTLLSFIFSSLSLSLWSCPSDATKAPHA